jgi:thiamine-phosphate pyrophosphorylase
VGPVFFTSSKQDLLEILGTEGLSAIKSAVGLPVLAIGGIDAARAGDVAAAGADGMAVISAVLGTEDVSGATKILLNSFKNKNTLRIRD